VKFEIDEFDRQAILLAIAKLSIERPGWLYYLGTIAEKFSGREMFEGFRSPEGTMKRGDKIKVRAKGKERWIEADVALVSGDSLALYCDRPLGVGGIGIDTRVGRITVLLLRRDGAWHDVHSDATCEVEEGA
jgi:hypothetical protein